MANVKHFSDWNGEIIELGSVFGMDNKEFAEEFPGVKGKRFDSFSMRVGNPASGGWEVYPETRAIEYKSRPSRHECDARCIHATGRVMKCECSCGGRNHGRGKLSDFSVG